MHWNQYASPAQQKEWSRVQAELRARETREYSFDWEDVSAGLSPSALAMDIAEQIRDGLGIAKWHGTKTAIVVRVLLPQEQDRHGSKALIRVLKLKAWTSDQSKLADTVLTTKLHSAVLESGGERGDQAVSWKDMRGVYTGAAIDDTWRASIGMAGGKPWASKSHA